MIIYNGEELSSSYVTENKVIEINSAEPDFAEFIKKVERNEDISSIANISVMKFSPTEGLQLKFEPKIGAAVEDIETKSKGKIFDAHTVEGLIADAVNFRPKAFIEYENMLFEQPTNFIFEPMQEIPHEEFLQELYSAYKILPTLWNEDLPLEEKKKMSTDGAKLIRDFPKELFGKIGKDNPIPERKRIEFYRSLSDYEKRIINNGRVHPQFMLEVIGNLRWEPTDKNPQNMTNFLLTNEILNDILTRADENARATDEAERQLDKERKKELKKRIPPLYTMKDIVEKYKDTYQTQYPELVERAKAAFLRGKDKFAPRVLSKYIEGKIRFNGWDPNNITEEQLDEIAAKCQRNRLSPVAKYKNPTLFALDNILNFSNMKPQLIEFIGVNITPEEAAELEKKSFFTWLAKNGDINLSLLNKILAESKNLEKFDLDEDPKKTYSHAKNVRGYRDCKLYESKYGYKFADNEIAIRGRGTVVKFGKYTMRFLDADDYANFTIGYDTVCCQHWGGAGESCVWKYTTDPFAAAVVIENNDEIEAQAFVWTNEMTDTFVFDNVEFSRKAEDLSARASIAQRYMPIIDTFIDALPYKNVHIGMGYNTLGKGIGTAILAGEDVEVVKTLSDRSMYSDYHGSKHYDAARVIKRDGSLQGKEAPLPNATVTVKPDEPTKWDTLASPTFNFMLNKCDMTPEERIKTAKEFIENPTPEAQMKMVRIYPSAVLALPEVCHDAQMYLLNNPNTAQSIDKIKNPCREVQIELFNRNPSYIRIATDLPESFRLEAVKMNGNLLEVMPDPSDEMIREAVKQNGYAIRFVPEEKRTEEIKVLAVKTSPKVLSLFKNEEVPDKALEAAIEKNPDIFVLIGSINPDIRRKAIELLPSNVLHMDSPTYEEAELAISKNPLLIRNLQTLYPELRARALIEDPWAIGVIQNPTADECAYAISKEPACAVRIRDSELLSQAMMILALNEKGEVKLDAPSDGTVEL